MTEKQTINTTPDADPRLKITRRGIGVAVAGAVAVGGVGGYAVNEGLDTLGEYTAPHVVYQETLPIDQSGSLINTVTNSITLYLENAGEDVEAKLPYGEIVYKSQEAASEWAEQNGEELVQPWAQFDVTLEQNKAGSYFIDIEPKAPDTVAEASNE